MNETFPMRIAVVNRMASVGGSHFEKVLLQGFRKERPEWQVDYYCDIIRRERNEAACKLYEQNGIRVVYYSPFHPVSRFQAPTLNTIWNTTRYSRDSVRLTLQMIASFFGSKRHASYFGPGTRGNHSSYDAVLYTWPFNMSCPPLKTPLFFIPHDLNFAHFFGVKTRDPNQTQKMNEDITGFVRQGNAIVSSRFMKEEVLRMFPVLEGKIDIVPGSMMVANQEVPISRRKEILGKFGITRRFFLYPCNLEPHKNVAMLASAVSRCRRRGHDVCLVLVGFGTECVGHSKLTDYYITHLPESGDDWTVAGFGLVSDEEIAALMVESIAVVTPSLYEAGNGPGLDAWRRGVPVAMSDLPFYTEALDAFGVRATLFDPMNADSIANALESILLNPQNASADALYSQEQIRKTDPIGLAQGYIRVIEKALRPVS